jgi:hypothetical protein
MSHEAKIKAIENVLELNGDEYIPIESEKSLTLIHELFFGNSDDLIPSTEIEYLYFGYYYNNIDLDENLALYYTIKSADLGNTAAMNNLGSTFDKAPFTKSRLAIAEKYYKLASIHGCCDASRNLDELQRGHGLVIHHTNEVIETDSITTGHKKRYSRLDMMEQKAKREGAVRGMIAITSTVIGKLAQDESLPAETKEMFEKVISEIRELYGD